MALEWLRAKLAGGFSELNQAVLPTTCLARSSRYEMPALVRSVAGARDWEGRQVYAGQYTFTRDLLSRPYGSDLRVWKTAHAMQSSVQDYRAGLPGLQEHIWGATLSTEVQVFATYPGSSSDSPSARPNSWAGQRILPRARQHRDSVLVTYPFAASLPTHVWFPVPFMDEYTVSGCWLAGRVGDGYVAVACAGGLSPVLSGSTARQEWLPDGPGTAFVATVACPGQDGSFSCFVSALGDPAFPPGGVSRRARDGRVLSLRDVFTVDGEAPDIGADGRPGTGVHLDNPACVTRFGDTALAARYGGHTMTVEFHAW